MTLRKDKKNKKMIKKSFYLYLFKGISESVMNKKTNEKNIAARLARRNARNKKLANSLPLKLAEIESKFSAIANPSNAEKRAFEDAKLNAGLKAIEILKNAILRKIQIQRNIFFNSQDLENASQCAFLAATKFRFFENMETSAELYGALSREIYNGLGINKTWVTYLPKEILNEVSEKIAENEGLESNVYMSLEKKEIMPILEAAFKSDTRKRKKAIFDAKVHFFEKCLDFARGGSAEIISPSGFRTAKKEFLDYIDKGLLALKINSLEDFWKTT